MTRGGALTLWLAALFLPAAAHAADPRLVPDVSSRAIDIQYSFTGEELLLFGAILYPGQRLPDDRADIVVVLKGPVRPIILWIDHSAWKAMYSPSSSRGWSKRMRVSIPRPPEARSR